MRIRLNKAHFPVTVLGPGTRVGIWLQGCTIRCRGCISRDTWPADPESEVEVDDILEWVRTLPGATVDGVTISGGEPFDQPQALAELLDGLDEWRRQVDRPIDLLAYSGRAWADLVLEHQAVLGILDAVVPEPFVQGALTDAALRGSANQRVVPLTELGKERYSGGALEAQRRQVQIDVDDDTIWFIGIPRQGDMRRMAGDAAAAGITWKRTSWLT